MKLLRLIRLFEDLSKGDPTAWSLVAACTSAMSIVLFVRQKPWFVQGGQRTKNILIAVMTTLLFMPVVMVVAKPEYWHR